LSGPDADLGFAGYYVNTNGGLYLTLFRAYDAASGRWINQDPIKERGGLNLYAFVHNNPVNKRDRFGLEEYNWEAGMYVPSPQDFDDDGNLITSADDQEGAALVGELYLGYTVVPALPLVGVLAAELAPYWPQIAVGLTIAGVLKEGCENGKLDEEPELPEGQPEPVPETDAAD
jgi:RHS repeat-associated protein